MFPSSRKHNRSLILWASVWLLAVVVAATVAEAALADGNAPAAPAIRSTPYLMTRQIRTADGFNLHDDEPVVDLATGRIYGPATDHVMIIDTQPALATRAVVLGDKVYTLALSPDGRRLYASIESILGDDRRLGRIEVVDTSSLSVIDTFEYNCPEHGWWECRQPSLAVGPEGRLYVKVSVSPSLDILDGETGALLLAFELPLWPQEMAIHGDKLYTLGAEFAEDPITLQRYDISGLTPILEEEVTLPYRRLSKPIIAPDGSFLVVQDDWGYRGTLQIDAASLETVRTYHAPDEGLVHNRGATISADSREVVLSWGGPTSAAPDKPAIQAFDANTGALVRIGLAQPDIDYSEGNLLVALPNGRVGQLFAGKMHLLAPGDYASTAPLVMANFCAGPWVDDFSDPASGWPIADRGTVAYRYDREEYSIAHRQKDRWAAVTRGDGVYKGGGVEVRTWIPANEGSVGLIFGLNQDWTEFYTLEYAIIQGYRLWAVYHYLNGWHLLAVDEGWFGLNQSIPLELQEHADGSLAVMLGGVTVYLFPEAPAGRIGLSGASFDYPVDLRYDDYWLHTGPHCPSPGGRAATIEYSPVLPRPPLETFLKQDTAAP